MVFSVDTMQEAVSGGGAGTVALVGVVTLPLHLTSAVSPVQLNSVVTAEALWAWLQQDVRSIPHPRFHTLVRRPSLAQPTRPQPPTSMIAPSQCSASHLGSTLERAERSLLCARIAQSWASAVVLSADGLVVTNAHLVRPYLRADVSPASLTLPVSVCLSALPASPTSSRRWLPASLVYCDSMWDLAVLKVDAPPQGLVGIPLPAPGSALPAVGERVYVLGHALFSPASLLLPTLTRGVLSKVVRSSQSGRPLLLQTDAAVHNGNSGGLLLSSSGRFLGLVTSNVMHTARPFPARSPSSSSPPSASSASSSIIPHLNFSIPAEVVAALTVWVRDGMREGEWEWQEGREEVEAVWALNVQEVWEVRERERSAKFKAVVEHVQRLEDERRREQEQGEGAEQRAVVGQQHTRQRARL